MSGWESKPGLVIVVGQGGLKKGAWIEELAFFCEVFFIRVQGEEEPGTLKFPLAKELTNIEGFIGNYCSLARLGHFSADTIIITPEATLVKEKWDDFLCRVFLRAEWRHYSKKEEGGSLQNFQKKHKYLLMSLAPDIKDEMGRLAAGGEIYYDRYGELVKKITRFPSRRGNQVNSIQHIFGYFSGELSESEKKEFLEKVGLFEEGKLFMQEIRDELRKFCEKHPRSYIQAQSFLQPFPRELLSIKPEQPSGK